MFLHPSSRRSRARFTINLVSRRWSGLFIVSAWGKNWNHEKRHATPRHATPRHARPGQARPGQTRPGQAEAAQRNKTREMRRCDTRLDPTAIICSSRVERSGAEPRHADEESRSFSINALPSRPPLNYTRLVPSVCLPRGRRVFINLHALRCALIVRK